MSGVVSGIAKVFVPLASVALRVLRPVSAVGAALFTGGAAMGAGPMAAGGLNPLAAIGGTLGSIAQTAFQRAGMNAFGTSGAFMGGDASNIMTSGMSTSGMGGLGAATQQSIATPTNGGGFFNSVKGGSLIAGLGSGLSSWLQDRQSREMQNDQIRSREKIAANELKYMEDKEERVRDGYRVSSSVHEQPSRTKYVYDPETGSVMAVPR